MSPSQLPFSIKAELAKSDQNVPFRAQLNHTHHTWARTYYSRPELYIQPQTLEEIQKLVNLARKCKRRIVVVGSGHSPSDLTCSSSWIVNLDNFSSLLEVDQEEKTVTVQSGIRLRDLNLKAAEHGLTLPIQGSIDDQSLAGTIATGTHGSSLYHGLVSSYVKSLRIVLSNGSVVQCSPERNPDLFKAALVSLGALGIIVEIEYRMISDRRIEWNQTVMSIDNMLETWNKDLWSQAEHTRIWWLPYARRVIVWRANQTEKSIHRPVPGWYDGKIGYYIYKSLLWASHYIPSLLPTVEWFVFGLQYGFSNKMNLNGVEIQRQGLLMNCLYSQFVNEWAIPFSRGPEAITKLEDWILRRASSTIALPATKVYVHAPIEVRIVNSSTSNTSTHPKIRPFLDPSQPDEPTLYLNATLYRPAGLDPPCRPLYYAAFEQLMGSLGGRPHWAKNFTASLTPDALLRMYGDELVAWRRVRAEVDPHGVFVGPWLRRNVLGCEGAERHGMHGLQARGAAGETKAVTGSLVAHALGCEETCVAMKARSDGGIEWVGTRALEVVLGDDGRIVGEDTMSQSSIIGSAGSGHGSEESFDVFAKAEIDG